MFKENKIASKSFSKFQKSICFFSNLYVFFTKNMYFCYSLIQYFLLNLLLFKNSAKNFIKNN